MADIVGLCCWRFLNVVLVRAQSTCRVAVEMMLHRLEEAPSHECLCFNQDFPFPCGILHGLSSSGFSRQMLQHFNDHNLQYFACYGCVAWQLLWAYPTGQQN